MSSSKLITGEALTAYERWELPVVGERQSSQSEVADEELFEPLTAEQLAAVQQEAYDEGFELGRKEGYEAGRKEGHEAGQNDVHAEVQRLGQVIRAFTDPLDELDEQVEQELVALALAVGRQILRRELVVHPEEIVNVVKEALSALPARARQVQVVLHPDDAELVRAHLPIPESDEDRWRLAEDASLTRGGCRVSSEHSRIDATVEKRLSDVINHVLGRERGEDDSEA